MAFRYRDVYSNKNLPKLVHNFAKYLIGPQRNGQRLLKLCQSGEFSPNLVALMPGDNVESVL